MRLIDFADIIAFKMKGHERTLAMIFGGQRQPSWDSVVTLLEYFRIAPNTRNGDHTELYSRGEKIKIQHPLYPSDVVSRGTSTNLREFLARLRITPDTIAFALRERRRSINDRPGSTERGPLVVKRSRGNRL